MTTIFARVYCLDRGDYDLAEETTERKGTTLCVKGDAIRRAVDEVRELHSGSVVQPALAQGDRIYFRIRIRFDPHVFNPFIVHKAPVDRRVLSGHDALECVDFRLNEIRNLPRPVVDRMIIHGSRLFSIEEAHFLLATALRADYVGGHKPFHKCRVLEKETWRRYAADDEARAELPDDMVIYHWKQVAVAGGASPATLHDFNVFLKFKIHKSSVAMVLTYVLLAFFIGFIGSYSANHVPLLGELFAKGQRSHQAPMNETRGR